MGAIKNLMIEIAEKKGVDINDVTNEDIKLAVGEKAVKELEDLKKLFDLTDQSADEFYHEMQLFKSENNELKLLVEVANQQIQLLKLEISHMKKNQ